MVGVLVLLDVLISFQTPSTFFARTSSHCTKGSLFPFTSQDIKSVPDLTVRHRNINKRINDTSILETY